MRQLVSTRTHLHTHTHIHTHTYTHGYTHKHVHTHTHAHTPMLLFAYTPPSTLHTYIHTYIHTYTPTSAARRSVYTRTHTHTYTHRSTRMHLHPPYIHTHLQRTQVVHSYEWVMAHSVDPTFIQTVGPACMNVKSYIHMNPTAIHTYEPYIHTHLWTIHS